LFENGSITSTVTIQIGGISILLLPLGRLNGDYFSSMRTVEHGVALWLLSGAEL